MAITILDANLSFNSNHQNRTGGMNGIVLHHAAASTCTVQQVHQWHLANGWAGIGYHFFVRKNGQIYRGRPENWIGAHAGTTEGNKMIGICAEGNFETEASMPTAQKNAIIELLKYLYGKYGVVKVYKHKDLAATGCPGKNFPFDAIVTASKNGTSTGSSSTSTKPETSTSTSGTYPTAPFTVTVNIDDLYIRSDASSSSEDKGFIQKGVYTITETKNGFGKLKSGAGWIYLDNSKYVTIGKTTSGTTTTTPSTPAASASSYTVRVTTDALNIRKGPGTNYATNGIITDKGVYTIVETSGTWGKLKSGAGWICLDYTKKV